MNIADRVQETTTATSTATIPLGGAAPASRTFASSFTMGATNIPVDVDDGAGNWENGYYTLTSQGLTRTAIHSSSNGGAAVAFPAGAKSVACTLTSTALTDLLASASSGGSSGVRDVAFSQSVPLTQAGEAFMPAQTVSGSLTFTPAAAAVRGALVYLALTADGTNLPNLSAFKETIGSAGYDNRTGIVNYIQFFYDGTNYRCSVDQDANATPAPIAASALTLGASSSSAAIGSPITVTVSTNSALTGSQSETVTFTAPMTGVWSTNPVTLSAAVLTATPTFTPSATGSGNISATASGTPTLSGATTAFTATAAAVAPGAPTIGTATQGDSYADFAFTAPASNGGAAITGYTLTVYNASTNAPVGTFSSANSPAHATGLTNGTSYYGKVAAINSAGTGAQSAASASVTPVAAVYPRLTNLTRMTESGAGPYLYAANGATTYGGGEGDGSLQLNAGDGQLIIKLNTAPSSNANEVMLALDDSSATQQYSTMSYAVVSHATGYTPFTGSGTPGTPTNSVSASANDYVRMKRTGSALTCDVSSNNGGTWTTVMSWAGVPTGVMYFHCLPIGTFTFSLLSSVGTP